MLARRRRFTGRLNGREMDEIDKHQTILNTPMSNFWKGFFFTVITLIIAHPIIRFELKILKFIGPLDYFLFYTGPLYWLLKVLVIIIFFYSSIGFFREKKRFNLFPMVISIMTLLVLVFA